MAKISISLAKIWNTSMYDANWPLSSDSYKFPNILIYQRGIFCVTYLLRVIDCHQMKLKEFPEESNLTDFMT